MNIKEKHKKLINSFKYAFAGIISSLKTEQNMRIHILAVILVIIAGFVLKISLIEWCICITLCGMVIFAELINTAIETTVDIAMPEINEKAKLAKDISAAAVLILAISSAIVGCIIFVPKIIEILK